MTEPPAYPEPDGDNTGVARAHDATSGAPRWVKVFGLIALVVVLLFVVLLLTGGGGHGPGRHTGGEGPGGRTAPSGMPNHGAQ